MDNIPKYIACKKGLEEPEYLHPLLEPALSETFGIPVYQEQVMQIARVLAGYTLGGADLLRRAMGKKIKEEMAAQRNIFVEGCKTHNNIGESLANAVFDLLDKFASYGFNKSHAAAYALIAYQTAYLKANYPYEFMAASMTYDMGTTDKLAIFKDELKRGGVQLLPPDVNKSFPHFSVEKIDEDTSAIRYALSAIKGVGRGAMEALVAERQANGPFRDLRDFAMRCDSKVLNKKQMENLTYAGALDGLYPNRAELIANMERILRFAGQAADERESGQVNLFAGAPTETKLQLTATRPWDELTKLGHESGAIGFYLTTHPLDIYRSLLDRIGVIPSGAIQDNLRANGSGLVKLAGIPVEYRERTSQKGNKYAFASLTDNAGTFEFMVFSDLLQIAREALQQDQPVICHVSVGQRDGETRLTLQRIEVIDAVLAREGQGIKVNLADTQAMARLAEIVGSFKPGKGKLMFALPVAEDHEAEFQLPQGFSLSPAERLRLQDVPGVMSVEMA